MGPRPPLWPWNSMVVVFQRNFILLRSHRCYFIMSWKRNNNLVTWPNTRIFSIFQQNLVFQSTYFAPQRWNTRINFIVLIHISTRLITFEKIRVFHSLLSPNKFINDFEIVGTQVGKPLYSSQVK